MLVNLALNDYFVRDVASDAGRVYQLHPLLREFLRQRAAQALPEATSNAWLERAAALLRDADYTEDAVALLVEAGNWDEIANIALQQADELLAQGRSDTLAGWLDLLPLRLVETSPRLLCASAASRAHASPRAARQLFERAFEGFSDQQDTEGMIESCSGIIDAIIFEFDDIAPLDRWLNVLDGLLARSSDTLPAQVERRDCDAHRRHAAPRRRQRANRSLARARRASDAPGRRTTIGILRARGARVLARSLRACAK